MAAIEEWAEELQAAGVLQHLQALRGFTLKQGRLNDGVCLWADEYAGQTISRRLNLAVLIVDIARDKADNPYRWMSKPNGIYGLQLE